MLKRTRSIVASSVTAVTIAATSLGIPVPGLAQADQPPVGGPGENPAGWRLRVGDRVRLRDDQESICTVEEIIEEGERTLYRASCRPVEGRHEACVGISTADRLDPSP